jgi:hypothetical protein
LCVFQYITLPTISAYLVVCVYTVGYNIGSITSDSVTRNVITVFIVYLSSIESIFV